MSIVRLEEVADRLAIQDVLCRYTRGIDRCDEAVLRSVWWPGAQADYGSGTVDAGDWSGEVVKGLGTMLRTQHFIGNMLITVDGAAAEAETYCRAYHEVEGNDGPQEMEVGGRYLDRLEKRGDEWRITHRRYVLDWSRNGPSTAQWDGPLYGGLQRRGARAPDDPSYTGA
ncbi:nuclear transport factor 2 family protein [Novosphingobium tardum]|uniref:Nuclear transport factor 2 family protein n=1 Tax=Novosphingobium tardum TaxID=1538021 RepID=A0ABV8RSW6_9SPHN